MAVIEIEVKIKLDGRPVAPFDPYVQRIVVNEATTERITKADGGGFVNLTTAQLDTHQFHAVTADQAVTLRIDGQSDSGIVLNAGGLYLAVGLTADASAATNLTVDNSSGIAANVRAVVGGT